MLKTNFSSFSEYCLGLGRQNIALLINGAVPIVVRYGYPSLTVQQPVQLNMDFLSVFFGAAGLPGPLQQDRQQQSRWKNLGMAQHPQQQHSRCLSLPQNVFGDGGNVGGAMPSAPTEWDDVDDDDAASFFFRLPAQQQHDHRGHHLRDRTLPDAAVSAATEAAAAAATAAASVGRTPSDRIQQRAHNRGRRFHTAAQHFFERLSAAAVADVLLPTAVASLVLLPAPVAAVVDLLPVAVPPGRRRSPPHNLRANLL